ncbi:hypothetical protein BDZ94DRAFT_1244937 [Collybia nuda]|uniref:GAR domain-containing protein n=1 Tax=Collybia nuda TaxID=64659 RepID=A0A9P6CJW4_9AGAR|nr:hypothetical protein BDZ94DRAFT_1244937 [Collybia nuda]
MFAALPPDAPESSGTAGAPIHDDLTSTLRQNQGSSTPNANALSGEEQALELHEVIELQTFSERKAWIEKKIKFLEQMPPIEVFVGLDALRASAEKVPGLPTRDELQQWLVEHDAIEKETEIFDTGELKKLRQLTKAATQRNLSPADTDVIELTLTTIYELDKLLHLLRDRSENWDLLGIRLTWEEHRISGWVERRSIIEDLGTFLESRARWTPSVYESVMKSEESTDLKRRGSIASMASATSESSITNPGFSRSTRFKLAEVLSRDAAQFAGRVTSLRHGRISAAGKALDKLIDHSRKPVPEVLLDEQDKLEEKGIAEMEHIGKFIMSLIMQWRKADEIYVETMKDKLSAQNLLEEIETAKLYHPTSRQSTSFVSRADALIKRIALRGNPASPSSTFPLPEHPLFGDQRDFNKSLTQILSSEISSAGDLAKKVDTLAKSYRYGYEAVKRVETLITTGEELSGTLTSVITRLNEGVSAGDEDGSSPNLMDETCLEPSRHSAFLTLLPSILDEGDQAIEKANQVLLSSQLAILELELPGIDDTFKVNAISGFRHLASLRDCARDASIDIKARISRLREARRIWTVMGRELKHLEDVRRRLGEAMEKQRWNGSRGIPAMATFQPSMANIIDELDQLAAHMIDDIDSPLASLGRTLESPLNDWLLQSSTGLKALLDTVTKMAHLLESIQQQASVMSSVRQEFSDLHTRTEDLQIRIKSRIDQVLIEQPSNDDPKDSEVDLQYNLRTIREEMQAFVNGLTERVPFVGRHTESSPAGTKFIKRPFSSVDLKLGVTGPMPIELPFDLSSLDEAARADSNAFVLRLNGKMESLTQTALHLQLAYIAKDVDLALSGTVADINSVNRELSVFKESFKRITSAGDVSEPIRLLSRDLEQTVTIHRARLINSFALIRDLLRSIGSSIPPDGTMHEILYDSRCKAVDSAETLFKNWDNTVTSLKDDISQAQKIEAQRLEYIRITEEERLHAEAVRLAAEVEENRRLERQRLEEEEQRRLEEEQRKEELRLEAERERAAYEEAEKARLEQEHFELEEKRRIQAEKVVEERRAEEEKIRIATEKAEKTRLKEENLAMEEKLRMVEAQLEQERRIQAERDAIVADEANRKVEEEHDRHLQAEKEEVAVKEAKWKKNEEKRERHPQADEVEMQGLEEEQTDRSQAGRAVAVAAEQGGQQRLDRKSERDTEHPRLDTGKRLLTEDTENKQLENRDSDSRHRKPRGSLPNERLQSSRISREISNGGSIEREDVFGLRVAPSEGQSKSQEMLDMQVQILALRKRLRSISINEVSRPSRSAARLPDQEQLQRMTRDFHVVSLEVANLPTSVGDTSVETELRSLRAEVEASTELMKRVVKLADLSEAIRCCDEALSDLLEHVDSYPASPRGLLSSSHKPLLETSPEEQLAARMSFTRDRVDNMTLKFTVVAQDSRAIAEKARILQTWSELEEMGHDRIGGKRSRPSSAISSRPSGRNSSASTINTRTPKTNGYANLSVSSSQKRLLAPSHPTPRRAVSGSAETRSRPPNQLSTMSSNRAVSGPLGLSVYGSTFASRQRTSSLSNSVSTPPRHLTGTPVQSRPRASQIKRPSSPAASEASSYTHSVRGHSRSSTSMSTWSRAPRNSLSAIMPRVSTPQRKPVAPRKTYVADPKNKLDVAVGDVVNKLPVGINIEGVSETWKDQSGKYWIGNQDPKLCFCRILRSQTVMVRVGGGWSELSKFIKDHFADSFRLMPESPPRPGAPEEKWISSATLLEAPEVDSRTPPEPPRTPEPTLPFVPSFSLSTPSGQSPYSIKSNSPSLKGSPLTPLQFIRRADAETMLRPTTPSKPPTFRTRNPAAHTQTRNSVWRP